jgi:hypothetical protein
MDRENKNYLKKKIDSLTQDQLESALVLSSFEEAITCLCPECKFAIFKILHNDIEIKYFYNYMLFMLCSMHPGRFENSPVYVPLTVDNQHLVKLESIIKL